ncbi:acyl carrier protein [Streptomyces sp. BHT-5-2]|uniref:acyl carrier protein n=1 Tax=Streptomyces sp. BHT-5-2 TaxID=2866715 RepID=UPI001C8E1B32|nr:acyl carrier protein [Streptomyces sp. BHT-5-2]QZL06397.1 acyl carrier protein [Streptomyces sp. BHT-5-2]
MTYYTAVRGAISALGFEDDQILPEARLRGDLELDSTELVEVSLQLQRDLGIEVKLELADDLTIADVCRIVEEAGQTTSDAGQQAG